MGDALLANSFKYFYIYIIFTTLLSHECFESLNMQTQNKCFLRATFNVCYKPTEYINKMFVKGAGFASNELI